MSPAEAPELGGADPAQLRIHHEISVDPRTGRAGLTVPIELGSGRNNFGPHLSLRYDSSGESTVWGTGWSLDGLLSMSVSTRLRCPGYDGRDTYTFTLGGDVVPALVESGGGWVPRIDDAGTHTVRHWRSRRESSQVRVEQWVDKTGGDVHWRTRDASGTVTVYGRDPLARIADAADPRRVFSWLAEASYDLDGNAVTYTYLPETRGGVDAGTPYERSRSGAPPLAQRYLKYVRYGNSVPLGPDTPEPAGNRWHFQAVFDYGDHGGTPTPAPDLPWPARADPHSVYRPGFEVRTYRLCRRILRFHDFDALGTEPVLVGAYRLDHTEAVTGSTLTGIGYTGFGAPGAPGGAAAQRDLPSLRLTYTEPLLDQAFRDATSDALVNTPAGLTGHRWIDLYGEGLCGILTDTTDAWYYKSNEGGGRFGPQQLVANRPAHRLGQVALVDFAADGNPKLAVLSGRGAGYYAFDRDAGAWQGFRSFDALPHLEAAGHRAQWLDVNNDGRAELLVADAEKVTWYPSYGTDGFGDPVTVALPSSAAGTAPPVTEHLALNFAFADMTGDGSVDQVRVGNGRIEYWPQLGNGRFGPPVLMQDAPVFAAGTEFDMSRLLLVDLDGDGAADFLYLGTDGIRWWRNASGNAVLEGGRIAPGEVIDNLGTVQVLDFLGDGTPCLVWSSPLPQGPDALRFARLTGGLRPHLLLEVDNGAGAAHRLAYASSAGFYLTDREAGRPWHTRLPMHHTVVTRHTVADLIGGTSATTTYAYHDGRYDAAERVIVFGAVDTYDVDFAGPGDPVGFAPTRPGCLRTWYHTGVDQRGRQPEAYAADAAAPWLAPHTVDDLAALRPGEYEHAIAALSGSVSREELYSVGDDGTLASHPFSVTQYAYRVARLQPGRSDPDPLAVRDPAFRVHLEQRLGHRYEQLAGDPRACHDFVLAVDDHGMPTTTVTVAYPRRAGAPGTIPAQQVLLADLTVASFRHIDTAGRYELGIPAERTEYHLTGVAPAAGVFAFAELSAQVTAALAGVVPVDATPPAGPAARLIGTSRHLYWDDQAAIVLPFGQVGARTLVHHTEDAVFTPGLLGQLGTGLPGGFTDPMLTAAGYTLHDGHWWMAGATAYYRNAAGFRLPDRTVRADGATTVIGFDATGLVPVSLTDPADNVTVAEPDYRHLEPFRVTDPNGAVAEVILDPLGVAIVTTSYGRVLADDGSTHAYGQDPLAGYVTVADTSVDAALADPAAHVQGAGEVVRYDLGWMPGGAPPRVVHLAREDLVHHGSGSPPQVASRIAVSVVHHDGFGRVLATKHLVEPGTAVLRGGDGRLILGLDGTPTQGAADPRWHASGHVGYNRKQQPVRVYDPYFSSTPAYEGEAELATFGAVETTTYDAAGRPIRVDSANGTHTTSAFTAWTMTEADANDTVRDSGYRLLRENLPAADPERQAYDKAAAHAGTPAVSHLDPAGHMVREVRVAAAPGTDVVTDVRLDARGSEVELVDARGCSAFRYARDMLDRPVRVESADAGAAWSLTDAYGRAVQTWDGRGVHVRHTYDLADRVVAVDVDGALGLANRTEEYVYGDHVSITDGVARNARGRLVVHRDQAGTVTVEAYAPGGVPLRTSRTLRGDYTTEVDWAHAVIMEPETYRSEHDLDALGRVRVQRLPDGSTRTLRYLAGGGLDRVSMSTEDGKITDLVLLGGADFTAHAQRSRLTLGNGVEVVHAFDPETQRTTRITARRGAVTLQDIEYHHDPAGNVVSASDHAQDPGGAVIPGLSVTAARDYTYDEFYQLTVATGRVHQALLEHDYRPGATGADAMKGTRHLSLNNAAAVERYSRVYTYDASGNLTRVRHAGTSQSWTTGMWVAPDSNRSVPVQDPAGNPVANPAAAFDASGHCTSLAHLRRLDWNYRGGIATAVVVDRSGTGQPDDAEFYVYDGDGARVRKVFQRLVSGALEITEKIYLDGCEIVRVRTGTTVTLERLTSHVSDESARVALVHRWNVDTAHRETDRLDAVQVRYSLVDHLGSEQVELDETGALVCYEEYFPYGGTSFVAGDSVREVRMRDHRFAGKECDDATGLYYFGHRYLAPWIGRWLSPDPIGPEDDHNLYRYVGNNPVTLVDPEGLQATGTTGRGTVHQHVVTQFPPEFQISLTPAQTDLWNRGQLVIVRPRGGGPAIAVSPADAQRLIEQETAGGHDVNLSGLDTRRRRQPATRSRPRHRPPSPPPPVTADDGDPNANGGSADGGAPDAGDRAAAATPPPGAEQGQDGTAGGVQTPAQTQGGDSGTSSSHANNSTDVHQGDGGTGRSTTPNGGGNGTGGTGGQNATATTSGTGVATGTAGNGVVTGGNGSGGNGANNTGGNATSRGAGAGAGAGTPGGGATGTANGVPGATNANGAQGRPPVPPPGNRAGGQDQGGPDGDPQGVPDGGSGGDLQGVPGGEQGGVKGGAVGGEVGGDLHGVLGGSANGVLDPRAGTGDAPPGTTVPPAAQTANGEDQRGGRGSGNGTGTGNGTDAGNGNGHGTGQHPGQGGQAGAGTGSGQHPAGSGHSGGATGTGTGEGPAGGGSNHQSGGGPDGDPNGSPSGTGHEHPDGFTRAAQIAGYFNLEFGNDPGGTSGGIPGGMGFLKGHLAQALYVAIVVISIIASVVKLVAKVGIKGILAGVRKLMSGLAVLFTKGFWRRAGRRVATWFTRQFWRRTWRRFARSRFVRFFVDTRRWKSISNAYWQRHGGAAGRELHHWLIPQRFTWVPARIRNAGFNLLVTPGPFNNWLDRNFARYSARWFAARGTKFVLVPGGIFGSLFGGAYGGGRLGQWLFGPHSSAPANPRSPQASPTPTRP